MTEKKPFEVRSISLTKEQNKALEEWKWEYKSNRSEIMRIIINYCIENPVKLEEIIKEGKKNEKK